MSEDRESQVFSSLLFLADALVSGFDAVDIADRLISSCIDLLGIDAAGVLIDDQRGGLQVLASSSEEMRMLELLQLQGNEGPCLDALRTGEPVIVPDLSTAGDRWPSFGPQALSDGFHSVHALPLRLRERTIGALNLFGHEPRALPDRDLKTIEVMVSMATIGLISFRTIQRHELLAEQLQEALNSRIVIEQAKGVLAERAGIDVGTAFGVLRRLARGSRRAIADVAADVATGRLDLESVPRRRYSSDAEAAVPVVDTGPAR